MSGPLRQLTQRVADVAKKTAIQNSPIVEGTVLSRNPDGSLNVDDGRGGCVRVAPAANVRVGQRIRLGTEPALGSQTSLPQVTLTLTPSTVPCPGDPRPGCEDLVGAKCGKPVDVSTALSAGIFSVGWVDPAPGFLPYPGRDGDWRNRNGISGVEGGPQAGLLFTDSNRDVLQQASRRSGSYTSHVIDPFANRLVVAAKRLFLQFDTSSIARAANVVEAKLRVEISGNTSSRVVTPNAEVLDVVPSTHDGNGANTANWDKIAPTVLGSASIFEILDAGPNPVADTPYTFDIPLDPDQLSAVAGFGPGGVTKLAVVTRRDADPQSTLPAPGVFSGREVIATDPTPDDKVHVSPGSYGIDGVTYTDGGSYEFILSQHDGDGVYLGTSGHSYIAALVQGPGGAPSLVKGSKGATPRPPTTVSGAIVLCWITVSCQFDNPSLISDGSIVYPPAARFFTTPDDPNQIQTNLDRVLFSESSDVQLLLTVQEDVNPA